MKNDYFDYLDFDERAGGIVMQSCDWRYAMNEMEIFFPHPAGTRNADDMGMPTPRQPIVWAYDLARRVQKMEEQNKALLDAAKMACKCLAEHNAGGTLESPQRLLIAQQILFNLISEIDPAYYGLSVPK